MWKDEPYGFSVDVWAYTIVVFEMLFGRVGHTVFFSQEGISSLDLRLLGKEVLKMTMMLWNIVW